MAITKNIRKKKRNNTRRKSRGGGPMDDYTPSNYKEVLEEVNRAQARRVAQQDLALYGVEMFIQKRFKLGPDASELIRERMYMQEQKLKSLVDEKIKPGSIIYICCLLDDKVIVNLLNYIVQKNKNRSSGEKLIVVWLQMNPYNVGVKGGTPWAKYKDNFFKLLKRVDDNLTTMDDLRAVGIYAVNPVELNNIDEIQTMLSQHDIDRPQPNAFGINKLYKLLSKQPGVTKGDNTKIVFQNDPAIHMLEQNITNENKPLVELFNSIVKQIQDSKSLDEWKAWIRDNEIQEKLRENRNLLVKLGGIEGEGTYTQILKLLSSIKVGPQLSNDWLGMMVASYITTDDDFKVFDPVGSNAKLPEVFNPLFLVDTNPAIVNGQTDFMNYLHTNWTQISNNTKNFPDMIIHDGEEDDILTVQFAAKMRRPQKLITVMQTSPSNISDETDFKKIFGNEEMFSFIHIDHLGIPSNMENAKKVKTAIQTCNSSEIWRENCFAKPVSTGGLSKKLYNYHKKYKTKKHYKSHYKKIRTIKKKRARKF
jgi:hypothetical protein